MNDNNPERLVVVTSTPQGVAPLTVGERSMIEHEGGQVEQAAVVGHAFPSLLGSDPARNAFEKAKAAFADSDAVATVAFAREVLNLQPGYLPAHLYCELGLNISRRRDLAACVRQCEETIRFGESQQRGDAPLPPTERLITQEDIAEILDMAHYNLSDRLMRLGRFGEALEHVRQSESLRKPIESRMKRKIKEASLLFRLHENEASRIKLKQARDMDRELFLLLRERMAFDGHAGVEQTL